MPDNSFYQASLSGTLTLSQPGYSNAFTLAYVPGNNAFNMYGSQDPLNYIQIWSPGGSSDQIYLNSPGLIQMNAAYGFNIGTYNFGIQIDLSQNNSIVFNNANGAMMAFNGSGAGVGTVAINATATFLVPPKIPGNNGYFYGATVAKTAGSGDTTGTISSISSTGYALQFTYTPGTATTANVDVITVTLGTALTYTPLPFVANALAAGIVSTTKFACDNVTSSVFKIQAGAILGAGTPIVFTVVILP